MKKIVILIAAAIALYFLYSHFIAGGPQAVFKEFCGYWGANNLEKALTLAVPDSDPARLSRTTVNTVTRFMMEAIMGITVRLDTSSPGPGPGEKSYAGTVAVLYTPPGVTSAMRATNFAKIHVEGTVRKTPSGWKVSAFTPTLQEMGEMQKH
jgi:hypothetical protein